MPGNRAETWERLIWGGSLKEGIKINQVNPKWMPARGQLYERSASVSLPLQRSTQDSLLKTLTIFLIKKLSLAKLRHVLRRKKSKSERD